MCDYDEIVDVKPHSRTRGRFVSEERYQKLIALETEVERLREQVARLDAYITHRDYDREILDENTRLREENEFLHSYCIDAEGSAAYEKWAREREERD